MSLVILSGGKSGRHWCRDGRADLTLLPSRQVRQIPFRLKGDFAECRCWWCDMAVALSFDHRVALSLS